MGVTYGVTNWMDMKRLNFTRLFFILQCTAFSFSVESEKVTNPLESVVGFMQTQLIPDVTSIWETVDARGNQTAEMAVKVMDFTESSLAGFTDSFERNLNLLEARSQENTIKTLDQIQKWTRLQQDQSRENGNLVTSALTSTVEIYNKFLEQLARKVREHESSMGSQVAVCARSTSPSHFSTVTYEDGLFLDSVTVNGFKKDVLDPSRGYFVVPNGASGRYHVRFVVTSTTDNPPEAYPMKYALLSTQAGKRIPHEETTVTAGLAPNSQTIFLDLREGDTVSLQRTQNGRRDVGHEITFCVHLVHPFSSGPITWLPLPPKPPALKTNKIVFTKPILRDFSAKGTGPRMPRPKLGRLSPAPTLRMTDTPISDMKAEPQAHVTEDEDFADLLRRIDSLEKSTRTSPTVQDQHINELYKKIHSLEKSVEALAEWTEHDVIKQRTTRDTKPFTLKTVLEEEIDEKGRKINGDMRKTFMLYDKKIENDLHQTKEVLEDEMVQLDNTLEKKVSKEREIADKVVETKMNSSIAKVSFERKLGDELLVKKIRSDDKALEEKIDLVSVERQREEQRLEKKIHDEDVGLETKVNSTITKTKEKINKKIDYDIGNVKKSIDKAKMDLRIDLKGALRQGPPGKPGPRGERGVEGKPGAQGP